jgi:glycyl-tRNA synthetase beta chain
MTTIPTRDLLFEVGTEEIPARMTGKALADLVDLVAKGLAAQRIPAASTRGFVTPRRLAVIARGVPERQEDRLLEKRGPAVKLARDADGNPTKAGLGFARSQGLEFADLATVSADGVDYVFARKQQPGQPSMALLPGILVEALGQMKFPKVMRWASQPQAFVRPIHWLLALFGADGVPFEFAGVTSSNHTTGHRFMGSGKPVTVAAADAYVDALEKESVIPDTEERRRRIEHEAARIEADLGLQLVRDPELTDHVVHLTEFPVAASGSFDEKFLEMPAEVLVTSMKNHQKFFAFNKDGKLANRFLVINNTRARDMALVVRGNQRVLAARLEDALFFYTEDREQPLAAYTAKLADQKFLAGLGTMKDKADRVERLAARIAAEIAPAAAPAATRAAALCKADLTTRMVGEFPELQGVMGREYARSSGEPDDVAVAIFEHYLPRFSGDAVPATDAGTVLALADRLDTIVGCFHLGLAPTPTKDPYALRRAALACVRILVERTLSVPLSRLVALAADTFGALLSATRDKVVADVLEFVTGRLRHWLVSDHATEVVDAVLACGADVLPDVCEKVRAIEPLRARKDYEDLILPFKRVINITRSQAAGAFLLELTQIEAEKTLYHAFLSVREKVAFLLSQRRYPEALALLLDLKPPVDRYFDDVLVNCEDKAQRDNHIAMLSEIGRLFLQFADFSRILV